MDAHELDTVDVQSLGIVEMQISSDAEGTVSFSRSVNYCTK